MSDLALPKTELVISDIAKDTCNETIENYSDSNQLMRNVWYEMKHYNRTLFDFLAYGLAVTEIEQNEMDDELDEMKFARLAFKLGACISYLALRCSDEFEIPVLDRFSAGIIILKSKSWDIDDLALRSLRADTNLNEIIEDSIKTMAFVEPTFKHLTEEEMMAFRLGAGITHYLLDRQYQLSGHAEFN